MTHVNTEQSRLLPWYAKAGAASSIVPFSRWVSPHVFVLKNGGYGIAASLTGMDEESLTDQELDAHLRTLEGTLHGLPEDSCVYQYSRVLSGYEIPRKPNYGDPVLDSFVSDRLEYLNLNAGFRRIDLFWCLTVEPSLTNPLDRKPKDAEADTIRRIAMLRKSASILEAQLAPIIGLRILNKAEAFPFFSYLFNLEPWANHAVLQSDSGLDRQIVQSPVSIEGDHLRVGKRYVQMFSLMNTPAISRPCQFAGLMTLDCDSVLCTTWRPKSAAKARAEISQQEKFISFFKVGVMNRVMSGRDTASLETGAGAKAANFNVDDLSEVIRSLDKTGQGEFTMRLLLAAKTKEQLHETIPAVHRLFVDARAQVMEESLGNLSAFYTMFPGNGKFNIFPLWLSEDHNARLANVFAPSIGHVHSEDLDNEYLNVFETRTKTPFFQDSYVNGVKVAMILGPTGSGKTTLLFQLLTQIADRGETAIVYDTAGEFTERFFKKDRKDWILNPLDARTPYWTPSSELQNPAEARTIATSMYQPRDDKRGEFFTDTPQKIFAHLLKYRPSPEDLVEWMSNDAEIDRRLKGTELANFAPKNAPQQRSGVLGSLGLVADSLRLLPTKEEAGGREWSATEWVEKREGWIFLTSTKATREALRPLQSLWIDLLVLRLMTKPKPGQKKVWLVIDELASLQRLPQFHTALTEGRKSDNPIIFAYQGKAQLETVYGHLAEVMLSMPSTKFILRTGEPNAAKWASELIGEVEIERVRETVADGKRQGKSFTLDRQIEPLVMKSELEGLPDLHTFVKINNYVSRFAFPHMSLPIIATALEPRAIPENKMWFNPLAPMEASADEQPDAQEAQKEEGPSQSGDVTKPIALLTEGPNEWMTEPEDKPKISSKAAQKEEPKPSSQGAPLKEAEALVPKRELPTVALIKPAAQPQSITHEL